MKLYRSLQLTTVKCNVKIIDRSAESPSREPYTFLPTLLAFRNTDLPQSHTFQGGMRFGTHASGEW
jgi:hypothetical protein